LLNTDFFVFLLQTEKAEDEMKAFLTNVISQFPSLRLELSALYHPLTSTFLVDKLKEFLNVHLFDHIIGIHFFKYPSIIGFLEPSLAAKPINSATSSPREDAQSDDGRTSSNSSNGFLLPLILSGHLEKVATSASAFSCKIFIFPLLSLLFSCIT
jgi:hypothetical protein